MFEFRIQRWMIELAVGLTAHLATGRAAALDCNTTQSITTNFTLTENYEKNGSGACFTIDAANVTVNLAGHSIVCETAGGCADAIVVNANGVTIRNGYIISGVAGGNPVDFQSAIENLNGGTNLFTTTIDKVTVDGGEVGVEGPGTLTQNCVFKNVEFCIWTNNLRMPNNGDIAQNYCASTTGFGIAVWGPTSGAAARVRRNYVRAASGVSNGGIVADIGVVNVEHNIIDRGDPYYAIGGSGMASENLCDDDTLCPPPDSDLNMSLDFLP